MTMTDKAQLLIGIILAAMGIAMVLFAAWLDHWQSVHWSDQWEEVQDNEEVTDRAKR